MDGLKLDLEKAYGDISCPFLDTVICKIGFNTPLASLVKICIFSTSLSVLRNGELLESFTHSCV